jgi:hypothetical protein
VLARRLGGAVRKRVYLVDGYDGKETWFWGVSFQLTGRKSYGHAPSLDEAKAAFKTEYRVVQPIHPIGVSQQRVLSKARRWRSP